MPGKNSKWFKVATVGPTVDGREIKQSWVEDIAETYSQTEYTANIFKDHYHWYGNFGQVLETKTEKDDKGRVCLFARIFANELLLKLNAAGQALFTSIYVIENFANTGKAYLGHLAITDNPASLGTEKLSFSGNEGYVFTAEDAIELDFDDVETDDELEEKVRQRPSLFSRLFGSQHDKQEDDMSKADLEALTKRLGELETKFSTPSTPENAPANTDEPVDWQAKFNEMEGKFNALQTQSQDNKDLKQELDELKEAFANALKDTDSGSVTHTGGDEKAYSIF